MKFLISLVLLLVPTFSSAPNFSAGIKQEILSKYLDNKEHQYLLNLTINQIKKMEGFKATKYICPAGQPTIGYGHMLLPSDTFTILTEHQADSLVRIDFNKRFIQTDSILPYHKRLALAHLIYNIGIGNFLKSKLNKAVKNKQSIDTLILKYCHYKFNGKWIKSNYLLKSRQFELDLWNFKSTKDGKNIK